jgi:hypothetical protein
MALMILMVLIARMDPMAPPRSDGSYSAVGTRANHSSTVRLWGSNNLGFCDSGVVGIHGPSAIGVLKSLGP